MCPAVSVVVCYKCCILQRVYSEDHQRSMKFARNLDVDTSDSDEYQSMDCCIRQQLMVSHCFLISDKTSSHRIPFLAKNFLCAHITYRPVDSPSQDLCPSIKNVTNCHTWLCCIYPWFLCQQRVGTLMITRHADSANRVLILLKQAKKWCSSWRDCIMLHLSNTNES